MKKKLKKKKNKNKPINFKITYNEFDAVDVRLKFRKAFIDIM